jgi:hypothetical protein
VKLSKTVWIAVIVGALIIGGACLLMAFNQQTAQKDTLEKNLEEARQKLAALDNDILIAQKEQLARQMDNYTRQSAEVKTQLSSADDSIDITGTVIKKALQCRVELLGLNSPGRASEVLSGYKYETISLNIRALGTTQTISDFVFSLKTIFPTCVIKSLSLDITEPVIKSNIDNTTQTKNPAVDNTTTAEGPTPIPGRMAEPVRYTDTIVNIYLTIYNYKGD